MEELLIKQIEAGIRALKLRTKTPQELALNLRLEKLKAINLPMYEDLQTKYVVAVNNYNAATKK